MERITGKPSQKDIKKIEPQSRSMDRILDMFDPGTRKGELALHTAAYRAGLGDDDEIVHQAQVRGKEHYRVVKSAFDAGKANLPDSSKKKP